MVLQPPPPPPPPPKLYRHVRRGVRVAFAVKGSSWQKRFLAMAAMMCNLPQTREWHGPQGTLCLEVRGGPKYLVICWVYMVCVRN